MAAAPASSPPARPPDGRDIPLLHGASGRQDDAHTPTGLSSELVLAVRSGCAASSTRLGQRRTQAGHVGGCAAVKPGVGTLEEHVRVARKEARAKLVDGGSISRFATRQMQARCRSRFALSSAKSIMQPSNTWLTGATLLQHTGHALHCGVPLIAVHTRCERMAQLAHIWALQLWY